MKQQRQIQYPSHILFLSCIFMSMLILAGCTGVDVKEYENNEPKLLIENYFNGKTVAKGVFQDRFGNVRRTFKVDITGTWEPETKTLTLDEDFIYNDGETENRLWTLKKLNDNDYEGTANGVVGMATGSAYGNAFNWTYTFDLPYNDDTLRVKFDDWMWLLDDKTLFNKATISKFGFRLGDVYITFEKIN